MSVRDGSRARIIGPVTIHLGHDHGAARPVFLLIMRVADAHRIRAGTVLGGHRERQLHRVGALERFLGDQELRLALQYPEGAIG